MTRFLDPLPAYIKATTAPGVQQLLEGPAIRPDGPNAFAHSVETLTDDTPSMMVDALTGAEKDNRFTARVGGKIGKGRRVGWSLRNSNGKVLANADGSPAAFGFTINPQGITYDHANRNQLFATKSRFYVDQFGPGSATITLRQLVASGGYVSDNVFAAREDVLTFLSMIYEPATERSANTRVFFHDMHLDKTSGAAGWEVFFPQSAVSVQRSVDLQTVWLVQITMQTLQPLLYAGIAREVAADAARSRNTYTYKVIYGDTLHSIAAKCARHDRTGYSIELMIQLILRLNPTLRQSRTLSVYNHGTSTNPFEIVNTPLQLDQVRVKAHHVTPGETLTLPR